VCVSCTPSVFFFFVKMFNVGTRRFGGWVLDMLPSFLPSRGIRYKPDATRYVVSYHTGLSRPIAHTVYSVQLTHPH
jgi:hypothetical protein